MLVDIKKVVMIGTSYDSKGGIASVVNAYRAVGLFDRWGVVYLPTHCDKNNVHKFLIIIKCYAKFVGLLARGRVGLLHAHVASRSSFLRKSMFIMLAVAARRPVIFHLHGAEFMQYYHEECGLLRKWFVRVILDHCAVIIGLSRSWQANLTAITNSRNVICIPNPVSFQKRNGLQPPRESSTLLFLGRLEKRKGIYELLEAITKLSSSFPEIRLLAGGDGRIEHVAAHAGKLGIQDRIALLGWVEGSQREDLFARATLFVLPSYNEGLPMGVLEAMAAGLPVVSTTVGGIPDAVEDGVEGLLIAPGNVDALCAAIAKLLLSSQLRQQMGEAAVRKVRDQFAPNRVLPKIEALYGQLGVTPILEPNVVNPS
ncbi:MAG: glycosyltransferase family 4 protein [Nitrospira sp.]|nr:glycosyltransferase family 4 protein [Nitrospira sp.]